MLITIAGYGYVGKAYEKVFEGKHILNIYDPPLGYNRFQNPDAVIICVSTPEGAYGECDVKNVLDVLHNVKHDTPVLLKSTISVEGWNLIKEKYPKHDITFSPEFLRAEHYLEDIMSQEILISGSGVEFWNKHLQHALPNNKITWCGVYELITAKCFRNAYLATKVAFFNQMFDYCNAIKCCPNQAIDLVTMDERIGTSHSKVTEERGYGGHCFPKDMKALKTSARYNKVDLSLIEQAIDYNKKIRST